MNGYAGSFPSRNQRQGADGSRERLEILGAESVVLAVGLVALTAQKIKMFDNIEVMKDYKIIVLGAQCAGKTTLTKYLKNRTHLNIAESDSELKKANGGTYPLDENYKNDTLLPEIENDTANSNNVIFLTSYFETERLKKAKQNGFKIVLLESNIETLLERNADRVKNEGYDDASKYFEYYLRTYKELKEEDLIDNVINANQPVETVAKEFLEILNYTGK